MTERLPPVKWQPHRKLVISSELYTVIVPLCALDYSGDGDRQAPCPVLPAWRDRDVSPRETAARKPRTAVSVAGIPGPLSIT